MLTGRNLREKPKPGFEASTRERFGLLLWAVVMLGIAAFEHAADVWLNIGTVAGLL